MLSPTQLVCPSLTVSRMLVSLSNDFVVSRFDDDETFTINLSSLCVLQSRFVGKTVHENQIYTYEQCGLPVHWLDDVAKISGTSKN
jgi:hypothetical protein